LPGGIAAQQVRGLPLVEAVGDLQQDHVHFGLLQVGNQRKTDLLDLLDRNPVRRNMPDVGEIQHDRGASVGEQPGIATRARALTFA